MSDRARLVRAVAVGAFAGFALWSIVGWGIPLDREVILLWVMAGIAVTSVGRPWRQVGRMLRDWLPFALVLVAYDLSRGAADGLGRPVQITPQIELDRWIGGGHVPTVWLQEHLIDPHHIAWWEVGLTLLYISHFIVPFVVAGVLWVQDRRRWIRYARAFVTVSFLGALTFVVFPAAPPWLASRIGYIGTVHRTIARGWYVIGLDPAARLLETGQATVNLVAAVPSLHAAYSLLVTVTLWPTAGRIGRVVLALYPLAMGFALVVSGEHYIIDIVIGWGYLWLTVAAWAAFDRHRARRRARRSPPVAPPPPPPPVPLVASTT